MFNLCYTSYLITSPSDYGVKPIDLPVLGSSFVHMESKSKLNLMGVLSEASECLNLIRILIGHSRSLNIHCNEGLAQDN